MRMRMRMRYIIIEAIGGFCKETPKDQTAVIERLNGVLLRFISNDHGCLLWQNRRFML